MNEEEYSILKYIFFYFVSIQWKSNGFNFFLLPTFFKIFSAEEGKSDERMKEDLTHICALTVNDSLMCYLKRQILSALPPSEWQVSMGFFP